MGIVGIMTGIVTGRIFISRWVKGYVLVLGLGLGTFFLEFFVMFGFLGRLGFFCIEFFVRVIGLFFCFYIVVRYLWFFF